MLNKVTLIGRLGADPEQVTFNSGDKITKLNIATWYSYKDKNDEWKDVTEWHICVHKSNFEVKARKGDLVLFEGSKVTRAWDDKDGKKHYATEIHGLCKTLPGKTSEPKPQQEQHAKPDDYPAYTEQEGDDDLPF